MENTLKCTSFENGFGVEYGDQKFVVSYEETCLPWQKGNEWAAERGGAQPTLEQGIILHEHYDQINDWLKEAGKKLLGGWLWTGREHPTNSGCAWAVSMRNGTIDWNLKNYCGAVRVVTAFPADLK